MGVGFEAAIILAMILANGVFSMSEIAVVSARRARLQKLADGGDAGAAAALEIAGEPNQFLSTVQIGITLIGTLAGAFGGATLASELATPLATVPWIGENAEPVSFALVVAGITYLSLVLGELVPKRIALNAPESIASRMAPPMRALSRFASPAVRFLSFSTEAVLKLLPFRPDSEPTVTEEEVRTMIALGADSGVFHREEREMVEGVFRLGDRRAQDLMTLRSKIVWIDMHRPLSEAMAVVQSHPYSRYPAARGSLDRLAGFVEARDLVGLAGGSSVPESILKKPIFVPETFPALRLIERFRTTRTPVILVVDEHGQVMGMLTPTDVLEAIVGDLPLPLEKVEPKVVRRDDGSLLVDGLTTIDELKDVLAFDEPVEAERTYNTVGGFVLHELKALPNIGDRFVFAGFRFEVVDMDGRRVDRVLISREPSA
jgi:putative hemolysin